MVMNMDTNKIAIEAIRKQIQKIAFDANLFDLGMSDNPYAERCSKQKKQLLAAIAKLEGKPVEVKEKESEAGWQNLELPLK